ncbi:MAG: hypothetical protein GX419_08660 [Bacteroidales bacterium]|nr:hypothetical protein [Bacteroidales bacterium]
MKRLRKITLLFGLTACSLVNATAQVRLLPSHPLLSEIEPAVRLIYNYRFDTALVLISHIEQQVPDHPVVPLLKALWQYHNNFPLITGTDETDQYIALCSEAVNRCQVYLDRNPDDLEGVSFDMLARAMINLVYVDNGETMKVALGASALYRQVAKGFHLMDQFSEFYFTTGLYNYYREAYPEAHPVYKPVASLFPKGSKKTGLEQLKYAASHCIFLRAEALFYLSLIYLNYEDQPQLAAMLTSRLRALYPDNTYYLGVHIESLFINGHFEEADSLIAKLSQAGRKNNFHRMKYLIFRGIYEDRVLHRPESAKKYLEAGIRLTGQFNRYDESVRTMAYFALSRVYRQTGEQSMAQKYYRLGKQYAVYKYQLRMSE